MLLPPPAADSMLPIKTVLGQFSGEGVAARQRKRGT
jgi:hypothetical protein